MLKKDLERINERLRKQNSDLIKIVENNFHILIDTQEDLMGGNIEGLDLKVGLVGNEISVPQRFSAPNTLLLNGVLYKRVKDYNKEE